MNKTQINLLSGLKRAGGGSPRMPFRPSIFVLIFAFILIGFEIAFLYTFYKNVSFRESKASEQKDELSLEIESLQREIVKLKSKQEEDTESKKDVAELSQKLKDGSESLLNVLSSVGQSLPESAWISYLSHKENMVVVNGFAIDNEAISGFVLKLKSSPLFEEVKLVLAEQMADQKNPLKRFAISCVISGERTKL